MDDHTVLVAAGGFGTRYGPRWDGPKSLIRMNGKPVLAQLLESIVDSMPSALVLVASNRREYLSETHEISRRYGATLVSDPGFQSTIDLARYAATSMEERFYFLYGHTLLAKSSLSCLASDVDEESASVYQNSTRRSPILFGERFLEPPFRVSRRRMMSSRARSWREYMYEAPRLRIVDTGLPPEPNTWDEQLEYFRRITDARRSPPATSTSPFQRVGELWRGTAMDT